MSASYPPPPWQTYGDGAGAVYVVPRASITLPEGFEAVSLLGRCAGVLAYLQYKPPSPLHYNELIWIPCMVRWRAGGTTHTGYWVEKMYVDCERSLAAGRTEWALPKTLARFERDGDVIRMQAEDGTALALQMSGRGPRTGLSSSLTTLQHEHGALVRFRCRFKGSLQWGRVEPIAFRSDDPGWASFRAAKRVPGSSGLLHGFEATMAAAVRNDPSS
jgi:hypothetical protein